MHFKCSQPVMPDMIVKSTRQILGMMDGKLSQEKDENDCITAGAVTDFIHVKKMCHTLGLKCMAEDDRYIIKSTMYSINPIYV